MDAYDDGREAQINGELRDSNPYPQDGTYHEQRNWALWDIGWSIAFRRVA